MGSGQQWWADQEEAYQDLCEALGEERRYTSGGSIDLNHLRDLREQDSKLAKLPPSSGKLYDRLWREKDRVRRIFHALFGESVVWKTVRENPEAFSVMLLCRVELALVEGKTKLQSARSTTLQYERSVEEGLRWRSLYASAIRAERKAERGLDAFLGFADEIDEILNGFDLFSTPREQR